MKSIQFLIELLRRVTLKSSAYLEELFPLPMVFNFRSECRAESNKFGLEIITVLFSFLNNHQFFI